MNALSWLVFLPLQLIWVPNQTAASLWVAYKQLLVSRRLGVSQTAIEVFNGRWTMAMFDMRDDPATLILGSVLPNTSVRGLFVALFPFWAKWKVSGEHLFPRIPKPGKESIADLVIARTVYFDQIIDRTLPDVEQFVMLGAGYDTRAYRALHGATVFEVDQPVVQQHKRQCLKAAGIRHDHVTFVSIDFSQDTLLEKLRDAGFDASLPTLFLWEGVTLYLHETAVRDTMRELRTQCAPGSVLLADFYGDRFMRRAQSAAATKLLELTAETVHFGFSFAQEWAEELETFVASERYTLGDTHFMGSDHRQGPYMVVAELRME